MQNFGETNKEHYGVLWYFLEWSITYALFWKLEGNWNRNASPNCFWNSYLGRAGQQLAKFFSTSLVTVPEVFAKVNSSQLPSRC